MAEILIEQRNATALWEQMNNTLKGAVSVENVHNANYDNHGFTRTIRFEVWGEQYEISWMWNRSELRLRGIVVIFDTVKQETTLPARYNSFLAFYYRGELVARIPTEKYESEVD